LKRAAGCCQRAPGPPKRDEPAGTSDEGAVVCRKEGSRAVRNGRSVLRRAMVCRGVAGFGLRWVGRAGGVGVEVAIERKMAATTVVVVGGQLDDDGKGRDDDEGGRVAEARAWQLRPPARRAQSASQPSPSTQRDSSTMKQLKRRPRLFV
jgi:hypothetical protein